MMLDMIEKYIDRMPSLPTTVTKVMEVCNNPKTSPADLNRIISMDPVLMGKVMQLINSAYYSRPNKITSLVRAIILLGLNTVKNLALSTAVLGSLKGSFAEAALNSDGFWEHSLSAGVTARNIARIACIQPEKLEEYFTAGLLHDIGKIPIASCCPEEYLNVIADADRNRIPLYEAERRILGLDHQQVGVIVAAHWKLDESITAAIAHHHSPSDCTVDDRHLVLTTEAADYAAHFYQKGFSGNMHPQPLAEEVYKEIGVGLERIEAFETEIRDELERARVFLQVSRIN